MNSNKYKVLIVEDEGNIRHFVRTILATNGYQVIEAKTLTEGRMAFMSHSPDVVILDLGLPDGDGMDFLKMIRKEFSTPVIVLSARTDEKDKVALKVDARGGGRLVGDDAQADEEDAVGDDAVDRLAEKRHERIVRCAVDHGLGSRERVARYRVQEQLDDVEDDDRVDRDAPFRAHVGNRAVHAREPEHHDDRPVDADVVQVTAYLGNEPIARADEDEVADDGRQERDEHQGHVFGDGALRAFRKKGANNQCCNEHAQHYDCA